MHTDTAQSRKRRAPHEVDVEALYILQDTRAERHDAQNPALDLPSARIANTAAPHGLVRRLAHVLLHGGAVVLPRCTAGRCTVAAGQPIAPFVVLDERGGIVAPMPDAFDAALYLAQQHPQEAWAWLERKGLWTRPEPAREAVEAVEAAALLPNLAGLVEAACAHFAVHPTVMLAGHHVPAQVAAAMDGVGVLWFGRAMVSHSLASGGWIIFQDGQRVEHDAAGFARALCELCLTLEGQP